MTNKLLSDEELIAEIDVLTDNLLAHGIGAKDSYDTRIFNLINTQKRLYAESVIGENCSDDSGCEDCKSDDGYYSVVHNELREEQRARMK